MKRVIKNGVLLFAAGLFLLAPGAQAGDLEDLKAAFQKGVAALNARDLEGFLATVHPNGLSFYACGPTSGKEGREACEQDWMQFFAVTADAVFNADSFQYRVVGSTGIVWGDYSVGLKSKKGGDKTYSGRYTMIYTKSGGKWLVVLQQNSPATPAAAGGKLTSAR